MLLSGWKNQHHLAEEIAQKHFSNAGHGTTAHQVINTNQLATEQDAVFYRCRA